MKRLIWLRLSLFALAVVVSGSAYAQATRTWVSGVGDDANPCSRTAPCKTFAGAISKTAPGGEIDALDPGGFGALTITKSITLDGGGGQVASVLVAGTNGIVVAAQPSDVVIIRNLRFDGLLGAGNANAGTNGIRFISGAALAIENCTIFGFNTWGIDFETSGTSTLTVSNTVLENNGIGNTSTVGGGGILIAPFGNSAVTKAEITDTKALSNLIGFKAIGDGTTQKVNVTINNSKALGGSKSGFTAESSNGPVTMVLNSVISAGNNGGVGASGAPVTVLIGGSTITENNTGVTILSNATVNSYKTNNINQNGTDGTPLPQVNLN